MTARDMLALTGVTKRFAGGTIGLNAVDLGIREGEFVSLLGPSGCGKTTTLRLIAGFEHPTEGQITLDGADLTGLGANQRPVNTVFQDYALFPHMDVAENVGFGLSLKGIRGEERRRRVAEALAMVGLADKVSAGVQQLSGGQRQRVALARAIVCEPRLLLLDEPLSALDAHLREQMQIELKRLQRELGTTFIMVTHDQSEALSISDRIVVMNRGRIEQIDTPASLYDRPASRFVAGFIGAMNLVGATVQQSSAGRAAFRVGSGHWNVTLGGPVPGIGESVVLAIRPEDVRLSERVETESVPLTLIGQAFYGRLMRLHLEGAGDLRLIADVARNHAAARLPTGSVLHASIDPAAECQCYAA